MTTSQPSTIYLKDYRPASFIVDSVHLHVDLHEEEAVVTSVLSMKRNLNLDEVDPPLVLNGECMALQRILVDGRELSLDEYSVTEEFLTVHTLPDNFILEVKVVIHPEKNTSLTGLYKSRDNFCTQCEAHGFRRITYYYDRPDVMSKFTTTITADKKKYPMLLSNGNLIEERELSGGRHWVKWEDPSLKPAYLFALVAGDLDVLEDNFITMNKRDIALKLYLEKGYSDQGAFALEALKKAMRWDEQRYKREYDLDIYMIVAVSDFNMGAMENKGLNIFNTKYVLAKPETATDMDYVGIEGVIGHEYFHNWTGNRITCRDWFQITLKEGLTVFRDQTFTEEMTEESVARIDEVNVVRNQQFAEDAGPTSHPIRPESYIEINNFYTLTVYRKGAEVIRMIRTLIGKEKFHRGMDTYFERHDGQAVTTEDFVQVMQDASGKDLTHFKRWYGQAGTPILDVKGEYDYNNKTFTVLVRQSCFPTPGQEKKEALHLPLAVGLIGEDRCDIPLQLKGEDFSDQTTKILEVTQADQEFTFVNVPHKPVPSLLRGFSAPVKLHYDYSDDELLWLLQCDSDPIARWDAGQLYMQRLIFRLVDLQRSHKPMKMDVELSEAFAKLLAEHAENGRYLSKLLTLPMESYLNQQMTPVDVEAVHSAHSFVKRELATALTARWREVYDQNQVKGYQFNVADMGKRSLKGLCLSYLVATEKEDNQQLAYEQFKQSDNMTDRMSALLALNPHDCHWRDKALEAFYQAWQGQPLVVNKWLSLQSGSTLPTTLDAVKACLKHPAFDPYNPNNVYALIGGFGANDVRFHAVDGQGYAFIADQVICIDAANPQVAARMVMPLTRWQRFDKARQTQMQEQLQRILKTDGLSNDVYELAMKGVTSM